MPGARSKLRVTLEQPQGAFISTSGEEVPRSPKLWRLPTIEKRRPRGNTQNIDEAEVAISTVEYVFQYVNFRGQEIPIPDKEWHLIDEHGDRLRVNYAYELASKVYVQCGGSQ